MTDAVDHTVVLPLDVQRELLHRYADRAVDRLLERFDNDRDHLADLADQRMTGLGAAEYGDRTWKLPPEQKRAEGNAELADAIVYEVTELATDDVAYYLKHGRLPA